MADDWGEDIRREILRDFDRQAIRFFGGVTLVYLLFAVVACWDRVEAPPEVAGEHMISLAQHQQVVADMMLTSQGLRARLEGRREAEPEIIYRTRIEKVPDTVYGGLRIAGSGQATLARINIDPGNRAQGQGVIQKNIDLSRCDDGLSIAAGSIVCDPARLGHLYVGAAGRLGSSATDALLGVVKPIYGASVLAWWEPYYRASWGVEAGYDFFRNDFEIKGRYGLRIF